MTPLRLALSRPLCTFAVAFETPTSRALAWRVVIDVSSNVIFCSETLIATEPSSVTEPSGVTVSPPPRLTPSLTVPAASMTRSAIARSTYDCGLSIRVTPVVFASPSRSPLRKSTTRPFTVVSVPPLASTLMLVAVSVKSEMPTMEALAASALTP